MEIPIEIKSVLLKDEEIDFCVHSKLFQKRSTSLSQIFGGLIFTGFPSSIFYLLLRKQFDINTVDGILAEINWSNIAWMIFPFIVFSIFILLGLSMFFGGIFYFSAKGGYFIGTNQRFITFRKGTFKSYDWE